jgi:hypothetical protein
VPGITRPAEKIGGPGEIYVPQGNGGTMKPNIRINGAQLRFKGDGGGKFLRPFLP